MEVTYDSHFPLRPTLVFSYLGCFGAVSLISAMFLSEEGNSDPLSSAPRQSSQLKETFLRPLPHQPLCPYGSDYLGTHFLRLALSCPTGPGQLVEPTLQDLPLYLPPA